MAESKERPPIKQVLIVAVIGGLLFYGCTEVFGSDKNDKELNERTAIEACENSVKNQIVAPGSADFSQVDASAEGDDYRVAGFVSGTTEDGGVAKRRWVCKATPDGDDTYVGTATIE